MKEPNILISGTWKMKNLIGILRKHKDGSLKINDAIWEIIMQAEEEEGG